MAVKTDCLEGTFGNLGTYSLGIPLGVVVDSRGARPGTILAAILLGVGYFSLFKGGTEIDTGLNHI